LARPRSLRRGALALAAALAVAPAARAMTVQLVPVPGEAPSAALLLQGHIVAGDARRLRRALAQGGFAALVLNSPGGSVLEARDMARLIRMLHVPVVVPDHAVCASACFMLFAAGRDRVAEPGAMIGVHSASVSGGNETMDSLGVTTLMAREAAQYGVPAGITGRMVTTAPGQMAWLGRADLESMDVRVVATRAAAGAAMLPGSGSMTTSDWTRGFERGRLAGADCSPPSTIGNPADFRLGCASGQRAGSARVAAAPAGKSVAPTGQSDWTRGFEYGRARGGEADCASPESAVTDRRDWSLGCASGRRATGG